MAPDTSLHVATRSRTGKGAARSLRRQGKVPGVIYGHDRAAEPVAVDTTALLKMLGGIQASTTIVDVTVDGRPAVKALIREIQRDPVKPADILHVDLYEVKADEEITVSVPLELVGIPDGVRNFGGVLDQVLHELELEVLPSEIPDHLDVDVTNLAIGQALFVRDVHVPKGRVLNAPELAICSVVAPRAEEVAPAPVEEAAVAPAEPELIRKPKEEGEAEGEAGE
jgi:large subunit ribosomal protein L25